MKIEGSTFVLTGANGGIGTAIAEALAEQGACLLLMGRDEASLLALRERLRRCFHGGQHEVVVADLTTAAGLSVAIDACHQRHDQRHRGIDGLIHSAGIVDFGLFDDLSSTRLQLAIQLNLLAPMQLTQALLPMLRKRKQAAIINIGSTFGSIGYPGYAAYCASKAGLRGFTEALRRELADSSVRVHYLAPRAVDTPINSEAVVALNKKLGNSTDSPSQVADAVIRLLLRKQSSWSFIGWPEKLFVRVNGVLPSVVDKSIRKQLDVIKQFASH